MMDYQVITLERHALKHWLKHSSYSFAASDALCPLVAQELPKAALALPIGFIAEGERFIPVAIQGLAAGQNLLVALDGRWLGSYIPALYRGYPFHLATMENGEQVLCIDEASGLISESIGEPFFNVDGTPGKAVLEVLEFFNHIEANRQLTRSICTVLQQHGLIQPWPLTVQGEQGEHKVGGLFRIDEAALNDLAADALTDVRNVGGLTMAYCQLLSMQHMPTLATLVHTHAIARKSLAENSLSKSDKPNTEFVNESGTFSFGNLS